MKHSIFAPGLLALLALAVCASPAAGEVVAIPHDAIALPGQNVILGTKFERSSLGGFWRPDVKNKAVRYSFAGRSGVVRTNFDGMALAQTRAPSAPGTYPFEAELLSPQVRGQGTLWVLDPNKPVAVVDIDGTISDLPDWKVPFSGARAPTFPGAPQLLADLAATHQIVYLTARDDSFDAQTRPFLARHGFPAGPVIYNDLGLSTIGEIRQLFPSEHGPFKLRKLQELLARGIKVEVGIGNAETDAFAYEGAGIASYLNTSEPGTGPTFRFRDFADLRVRLRADGVLP